MSPPAELKISIKEANKIPIKEANKQPPPPRPKPPTFPLPEDLSTIRLQVLYPLSSTLFYQSLLLGHWKMFSKCTLLLLCVKGALVLKHTS